MRCIERCAGFKLQELVARKEVDVHDLKVDKELATEFVRVSASPHNKNIGSQFNAHNGDVLVEDLSVPSQIEMSHTESLPLNTSSKPLKKKKLFSALDILEDNRSTVADEDDDDDSKSHDSLLDDQDKDSDDDMDGSLSRSKEKEKDVLETDFYDSMKSKISSTDVLVISHDDKDERNNDLNVIPEGTHSLRGDLAKFAQDKNRGDTGHRRKFSL